jgi:hypothetical protein
MLPKDAKRRREQAVADQQPSISGHLKPRAPNEHVVPYTDELFREAAIEWLIETDQVRYSWNYSFFMLFTLFT